MDTQPPDVRGRVWRQYLLANATMRYLGALGAGYRIAARISQLVTFLTSSGAAVALAGGEREITLALSCVAAVASGVLLIVRPEDVSRAAEKAADQWRERCHAWEMLWLRAEDDPAAVSMDEYKEALASNRVIELPRVMFIRWLSKRTEQETYSTLASQA